MKLFHIFDQKFTKLFIFQNYLFSLDYSNVYISSFFFFFLILTTAWRHWNLKCINSSFGYWKCFIFHQLQTQHQSTIFHQTKMPKTEICSTILCTAKKENKSCQLHYNTRWEVGGRFKREGTYVLLCLIHVDV